ncbi:MAG: hypothetical protein ACXW33_01775 [Sulfuricurvum sp.]
MKFLFFLLIFLVTLEASENKAELHLRVTHGGIVSTKIILSAINAIGQHAALVRYENNGETIEMDILLSGRKAFDAKTFGDLLRESAMVFTKGSVQNKSWHLDMDGSAATWNIPSITIDEGAQLEKSALPHWFVVDQAKAISVEAPYGGKWYPDVAVMDANMQVLVSFRTFTSRDQMSFALPEGAKYLKISSTNGMKLLKEGTWVEHATE